MTVTYLEEMASGRTAKNSKGVRTYQAQFKLTTSEQTDRPYDVGSHPSLPYIGMPHPDDPYAWCTDLSIDPSDPWSGWTATATWTTEREVTQNPTSEPAVITWSSDQYQKPAVVDNDDYLIVNSAGDPFDPPAMMDDSRISVTVVKNVSATPAWVLQYHNAVNSNAFTIDGISIAAGVAKIQSISISELMWRGAYSYKVLSYTMALRYEGWILYLLDAGMRKISGSTRVSIPNADAPVPLNGLGQPIAEPTFLNAVYGQFNVYRSLSFASLPIV
jgi:hypothetical protein